MKYIYLILISSVIYSCGGSDNREMISNDPTAKKEEFKFCQNIISGKTPDHINFLFSRLFIAPPSYYSMDSINGGLYKDNENYIQVQEYRGINFNDRKNTFSKLMSDPGNVEGKKYCAIKVNEYEGYKILGYMKSNDRTQKKIELAFGNTDFSMMLIATYNNDDDGLKILNSIQSIFFDKDYSYDCSQLMPFNLDLNKTKFKLNNNVSSIYSFTLDGLGEPTDSSFTGPHFEVFKTPYLGDTTKIIEHFRSMLSGIEKSGVVTKQLKKEVTFDHKHRWAYVISKDIYYHNKKGVLYLFVTASIKGNLVLLGTSYQDLDKSRKAFENISMTLDFK